jgi:hypothetical protein
MLPERSTPTEPTSAFDEKELPASGGKIVKNLGYFTREEYPTTTPTTPTERQHHVYT